MNTFVFDHAECTPMHTVTEVIPADWKMVYHDWHTNVYKNTAENAVAILSCDDDGIVRYCDVKKQRGGRYASIYLYNGIFNIHSYRDIRDSVKIDKKLKEKYGCSVPVCTQLDMKSAFRTFYRKKHDTPVSLSVPLRNNVKAWRTVSADHGESCADFIIIPDKWGNLWETDPDSVTEDIEQFVHDTVYCYSGYDYPTGKVITLRWSYKRIPAGVAIIHERGIDW